MRGETVQEILTVVTRKGQITVPAKIRQMLNIKIGDKLALVVTDPERGEVTLRRVASVAEATYGAVTPAERPEKIRELRRQAVDDMAENAAAEGREPATA